MCTTILVEFTACKFSANIVGDESSCRLPLSDRLIISRDTSILVIRQVISMISTIRSFVVTSVADRLIEREGGADPNL